MSVCYLEDVGPVNLRLMVPKLASYIALWSTFDRLGKCFPSAVVDISPRALRSQSQPSLYEQCLTHIDHHL
jgi:hypothetical protein